MTVRDEQQQAPAAGARAPIRRVPRTFAWLIVSLRYPIIVAWIAAAVLMSLQLPSIGEGGGGELGGVVPEHSQAVRAEKESLTQFEFPLTRRTMVIERPSLGGPPPSRDVSIPDLRGQRMPAFDGADSLRGRVVVVSVWATRSWRPDIETSTGSSWSRFSRRWKTAPQRLPGHRPSARRARPPERRIVLGSRWENGALAPHCVHPRSRDRGSLSSSRGSRGLPLPRLWRATARPRAATSAQRLFSVIR